MQGLQNVFFHVQGGAEIACVSLVSGLGKPLEKAGVTIVAAPVDADAASGGAALSFQVCFGPLNVCVFAMSYCISAL
jgi:hypothetical protein